MNKTTYDHMTNILNTLEETFQSDTTEGLYMRLEQMLLDYLTGHFESWQFFTHNHFTKDVQSARILPKPEYLNWLIEERGKEWEAGLKDTGDHNFIKWMDKNRNPALAMCRVWINMRYSLFREA